MSYALLGISTALKTSGTTSPSGSRGPPNYGFNYEVPVSREGVDLIFCSVDTKTYWNWTFCQDNIRPPFEFRPFSRYENFPADPAVKHLSDNLEEQWASYSNYTLNWPDSSSWRSTPSFPTINT